MTIGCPYCPLRDLQVADKWYNFSPFAKKLTTVLLQYLYLDCVDLNLFLSGEEDGSGGTRISSLRISTKRGSD